MKKEWLLPPLSIGATLLVALVLLRWFAPQLLGIPADLQMVRVSDKVPPFFDGVFRDEDYAADQFLIRDPYVLRAKPLYPDRGSRGGPHDILGFRNRSIPDVADVITVGDSQTYGNNVPLEENWPSRMRAALGGDDVTVYNMAVGGWGAVEYLEIFPKALRFAPGVTVIAFYTGNDPLESFKIAYAGDRWQSLRPDPRLQAGDVPPVVFPAPRSEWWPVRFSDGTATVFTPTLRYASNQDHPAVRAGYEIMAEVARRIGKQARSAGVHVVFTILPTKELVYAEKVASERLDPPADYRALVAAERSNLERLASTLQAIEGARYIDLLGPLQSAAAGPTALYPHDIDGHPLAAGYRVIGETLAREVGSVLSDRPRDAAALFQEAFQRQRSGDRAKAIEIYEQVLGLDPGSSQAAFNLAFALTQEGTPNDLDRAAELLEQVVRQRPDYTEALYRLAEAERLGGNLAGAVEHYRRFLEAGGHPDLVRQARERLGELEDQVWGNRGGAASTSDSR
jgi:lysophospholipase L1-like esterase